MPKLIHRLKSNLCFDKNWSPSASTINGTVRNVSILKTCRKLTKYNSKWHTPVGPTNVKYYFQLYAIKKESKYVARCLFSNNGSYTLYEKSSVIELRMQNATEVQTWHLYLSFFFASVSFLRTNWYVAIPTESTARDWALCRITSYRSSKDFANHPFCIPKPLSSWTKTFSFIFKRIISHSCTTLNM